MTGAELINRYNAGERDFSKATLNGADLSWAKLERAKLSGAYLGWADLRWANLSKADLCETYLFGANLKGATINWTSHALLAAILQAAAGTSISKRMVAGLIAISTDWCWSEFLAIEHTEKEWALKTLAEYVREGDGAPAALRKLHDSNTQITE